MTYGAMAADRWQAIRRFPGRIPLHVKLITAVLTLVVIALIAISVAGISFLRTFLLNEADGTLHQVSQSASQSAALQHCLFDGGAACGVVTPTELAVYWLPQHGSIQPVMLPATPYRINSLRPVPPPAVAQAATWLEAHPGQPATIPATSGDGRWRVVSYQAAVDTQGGTEVGTVVTGIDITNVYRTVGRLASIDLIVSAIIVAALAVVGVAIVRSSLRPLTDIERTAQKIASGDLSQRVPERDPRTEVGRLGQALNTMLAQVEAAFHARAESERAARNSEERMRQFVADASHELRTPVTVIRGYAEYYRQRGGLDQEAAQDPSAPATANGTSPAAGEPGNGSGPSSAPPPNAAADAATLGRADMDRIIERVEQESARMGGLVEDLLLLARLDQQRPVERTPVDLLTLAGDAVQDARAIAPGRQIGLSVGTGTAFLVMGDEARLRQVIGNLMSNALTHTPDGTPIEVSIRAGTMAGPAPQPAVLLEVADRGPGMTAEQARRAFERFYRADQSRERRTGGTGLGLAIVSALVAAHGGTVSVDTAPGEGATFRITLPLAPEAQGQDAD